MEENGGRENEEEREAFSRKRENGSGKSDACQDMQADRADKGQEWRCQRIVLQEEYFRERKANAENRAQEDGFAQSRSVFSKETASVLPEKEILGGFLGEGDREEDKS